jgi:uncharacterized membrane protein YhaH (DUF805 family)
MSFGHIFFGFSGRANRAKYWLVALFWGVLITVAVGVMLTMVIRDVTNLTPEEITSKIMSYGLGLILFILIVFIPAFISSLAIGVKRLHDRNKSGWWILVFYFVPSILNALSFQVDGPMSTLLTLAGFAISLWGLVELGFLRGTVGPNQYGPDPLEGKA